MSSVPMDFSGRVDISASYSNPNVDMMWSTSPRMATTSSTTWSRVQNTCASSWVKPRARSRPCTTPDISWRYTVPNSK